MAEELSKAGFRLLVPKGEDPLYSSSVQREVRALRGSDNVQLGRTDPIASRGMGRQESALYFDLHLVSVSGGFLDAKFQEHHPEVAGPVQIGLTDGDNSGILPETRIENHVSRYELVPHFVGRSSGFRRGYGYIVHAKKSRVALENTVSFCALHGFDMPAKLSRI